MKKIISFIRKYHIYILELIAFIILIVITIVINVSNTISKDILGLLLFALVCFGTVSTCKNIIDNKNRDLLHEILDSIKNKKHYKLSLDSVLKKRDAFNLEFISNAQNLCITGGSLVRIADNINMIKDKVNDECEIRFILVEPLTPAAKILGNVVANKKENAYNQQIITSLETLLNLSEKNPNRIFIKTIDFVPSLSFVSAEYTNNIKPSEIKVEIYSHHCSENKRINFSVKTKDSLFDFFKEEITSMWEEKGKQIDRNILNMLIHQFEEMKKQNERTSA